MRSNFAGRVVTVAASAVVVLGGGTYALASGSPSSGASGTTFYACVVTHGSHSKFPFRSLWKTSTKPVTCPKGEPSISWNQAGPQGPAGPAGAIGPVGRTGKTGPQGPAGATGATGAQGPKGDTGGTGAAGPQGPPGATGATGAPGPKGDTGATGAQGPKGDTGATGAAGPQGATGAPGAQGAAGAAGAQGPKGDKGDTGAAGPAGPQGPQGPAGTFGSITVQNLSLSLPTGEEVIERLGCTGGGTPISGGESWGGFVPNVTIEGNTPTQDSGTPSTWFFDVANLSGQTVTVSMDVVCATAVGASPSAAPQNHTARVIKRTMTKIHQPAKG